MIHTMLPAQYSTPANAGLAHPQRRLMAAVLQAVVDDCRSGFIVGPPEGSPEGNIDAIPRGVRKAIAYVASVDRVWPFSFENLCEALGLDPQRLRRELDVMRVPA
jgi:hypothetical protein